MLRRIAQLANRQVVFRFCDASENKEVYDVVRSSVFNVLKSAAKCKTDALAEKATFTDLGFDSLDGVELVVAMEETFGYDIKNEEAERIQTVQDAISIFYKYELEKAAKVALAKKQK